jgi:hypothetical protein
MVAFRFPQFSPDWPTGQSAVHETAVAPLVSDEVLQLLPRTW